MIYRYAVVSGVPKVGATMGASVAFVALVEFVGIVTLTGTVIFDTLVLSCNRRGRSCDGADDGGVLSRVMGLAVS